MPEPCEESAVEIVRRMLATDTSPSNRLVRRERGEQVMAALASLSPRDREVLAMRHLEELSPAEIAEALGVAEIGRQVASAASVDPHSRPNGNQIMKSGREIVSTSNRLVADIARSRNASIGTGIDSSRLFRRQQRYDGGSSDCPD